MSPHQRDAMRDRVTILELFSTRVPCFIYNPLVIGQCFGLGFWHTEI
jgi:hypothetical protein